MPQQFEPGTTVNFGQTGIDQYQKVFVSNPSGVQIWGFCVREARRNGTLIEAEALSYIRSGHRLYVAVDTPYDALIQCDTVWFQNQIDQPGGSAFWWIGHIVSVEWINPNCNHVHFIIDAYSTFGHLIDWSKCACYVDREHVKGDWVGDNPAFSNMGPAEGISVEPDTVLYTYNKHFEPDMCMVYTPYAFADYKPNFGTEIRNGVYDAMNAYLMTPDQVSTYLKGVAESEEADITGVQGIYTFPSELQNADGTAHDEKLPLPWVDPPSDYPEINNSKCWSGEFCTIKLMSWLGGAITFNPQWFGGGKDSMPFSYRAFYAGGELIIQATLKPNNETFTWEGFKDFILSINELPQAHWIGDGYAQYKSTWMLTNVLNGASSVMNQVSNIAGFFEPSRMIGGNAYSQAEMTTPVAGLTGTVGSALGVAGTISNVMSQIRQAKMTGLVQKGSVASNPNAAAAQKTYGFTVVAYGCQPYLIKTIDAFFDRYGYCVNTIKVPETNSRPYWNYVKCHEAHINGNIPYSYRTEIENMLNEGVTFWNETNISEEHPLGDFSDPKRNKEA